MISEVLLRVRLFELDENCPHFVDDLVQTMASGPSVRGDMKYSVNHGIDQGG